MAGGDKRLTEEAKSSTGLIVLGVVAAVAVGAGVLMFLPQPEPEPEIEVANTTAPQIASSETTVVAEPVPDQGSVVTTQEDVAEEVTVAEPPVVTEELAAQEEPIVEEPPTPPVFDTFRVETDGSMVIAGRAIPGQIVDILLAGEAIERVTADGGGNFVALPQADPSDQPRTLSLVADPDGLATPSETSFIVAAIAEPQLVVAALPEPATPVSPTAGQAPGGLGAINDDGISIPTTALPSIETASAAPLPPTVLQADADGIRVIQTAPDPSTPDVDPNVGLDAITYNPSGDVQLSGRAAGNGAVQIYLDNKPISTSDVTQGGDWQIDLPEVDTGIYTLRIDEVDDAGEVVSRIETPFKREEAEDVAAVLAEETSQDGFEVAVKTVQPGATLWAIAEENLGDGIFFVEVFEANSDLIKDPDLIYPGQIFRIPEKSE